MLCTLSGTVNEFCNGIQKFYFLSRSKNSRNTTLPSTSFLFFCVKDLSGKQRKSVVATMKGPLVRWPSPVRRFH